MLLCFSQKVETKRKYKDSVNFPIQNVLKTKAGTVSTQFPLIDGVDLPFT